MGICSLVILINIKQKYIYKDFIVYRLQKNNIFSDNKSFELCWSIKVLVILDSTSWELPAV